jgi:hypothetical protein
MLDADIDFGAAAFTIMPDRAIGHGLPAIDLDDFSLLKEHVFLLVGVFAYPVSTPHLSGSDIRGNWNQLSHRFLGEAK